MPFRYWSFDHWMNFGIFLLGAITAVGITASTQWGQVPSLFTPATTIGFAVSTLGFLRASVTNAARNPDIGTRSTDPNPTERVVQVGQATIPVPPVTPGRPVELPKEP